MKATREDTIGYNLKKDTALDVEVMWKRLVCHLFYVVVHVGAESKKKDQLKEEKNWTMTFRWASYISFLKYLYVHLTC